MKKAKKQIIRLIVISILIATSLILVSESHAETIFDRMQGAITGVSLPGGGDVEAKAQSMIGTIINGFLSLVGVFFLILVIYGGFQWMNARGREEEIKKAKDIVRSAIIGMIIVMSAYAIAYFVSNALQSAAKSPRGEEAREEVEFPLPHPS
jgi:amino acid transporter